MVENPVLGQTYWTFGTTWKNCEDAVLGFYTNPWQGTLRESSFRDEDYCYELVNPADDDDYIIVCKDDLFETEDDCRRRAKNASEEELMELRDQIESLKDYIDNL